MDTVKMQVPAGGGNVSFDGNEYLVGADGVIEVPAAAVTYLAQYGYAPMPAGAEGEGLAEGEDAGSTESTGGKRQEEEQPQTQAELAAEVPAGAEGKKPAGKAGKQAARQ